MLPLNFYNNKKIIIDFHTHGFPEKIAEKTIEALKKGIKRESGSDRQAYTDGTPCGLRDKMKSAGITASVILPIVTHVENTSKINEYALDVMRRYPGEIYSFAGAHPDDADIEATVYKIAESGFSGIKLHPEFQNFYIDSPKSITLLKSAKKNGLAVTVHAGADIGMPPPVHCTPDMLLRVMDILPDIKLIAAHLGGWLMWDAVASKLCQTPILFDTAFLNGFISLARYRDIVRAHGADKVLFGSDCPWEDPVSSLDLLYSLGLDDEENRKIEYKNAASILGMA